MHFFDEMFFVEGQFEITEEGKRFLMKNTFLYLLVLIFALKIVDVSAIGPGGTNVGLSRVNLWFRNLWRYDGELGYAPFWYKFIQVLGSVSLALCAFWVILFFRDMIQSGGWDGAGTDKNLAATFFLFVLVVLLCLPFKKLVVNYGPVLMPDRVKPSASFPSIYTVLFILAWGSTMFHIADTYSWGNTVSHIADMLGGPKNCIRILHIACTVIMLSGIFGCLRCGLNWFTDVIGGILFSVTLLFFYSFFFDI